MRAATPSCPFFRHSSAHAAGENPPPSPVRYRHRLAHHPCHGGRRHRARRFATLQSCCRGNDRGRGCFAASPRAAVAEVIDGTGGMSFRLLFVHEHATRAAAPFRPDAASFPPPTAGGVTTARTGWHDSPYADPPGQAISRARSSVPTSTYRPYIEGRGLPIWSCTDSRRARPAFVNTVRRRCDSSRLYDAEPRPAHRALETAHLRGARITGLSGPSPISRRRRGHRNIEHGFGAMTDSCGKHRRCHSRSRHPARHGDPELPHHAT